jgi:hypothetical protein
MYIIQHTANDNNFEYIRISLLLSNKFQFFYCALYFDNEINIAMCVS